MSSWKCAVLKLALQDRLASVGTDADGKNGEWLGKNGETKREGQL